MTVLDYAVGLTVAVYCFAWWDVTRAVRLELESERLPEARLTRG